MGYRIAEAAERVGVPTTTLRYYEDIGLFGRPARSGNGYRTYSDADVSRLRFISATKGLGIPLSEVAELVKAYDVEDCSEVAHQVVELVAVRLAETQTRIGELVSLAAQLQDVGARLAAAPAAGACGDGCPCSSTALAPAADRRTLVPLTLRPVQSTAAPAEPVIACSLEPGSVPSCVADWQELLARAVRRESVDGGVALTFLAGAELVADTARLAAAEQTCCPFLTFSLHLTSGELRLEVRAPDDAADVLSAMFGPA